MCRRGRALSRVASPGSNPKDSIVRLNWERSEGSSTTTRTLSELLFIGASLIGFSCPADDRVLSRELLPVAEEGLFEVANLSRALNRLAVRFSVNCLALI